MHYNNYFIKNNGIAVQILRNQVISHVKNYGDICEKNENSKKKKKKRSILEKIRT